ncbi:MULTISPECIES: glutathione peroxidase [Sphingobacterium]|uniref:glutathione peroxidase n=1 Tax=Sphingobacterium TaxID=28453 RepID=UPI000B9AD4AE|nr:MULTISPECIES: glutathione peroxidase [Sphingobacterium]UPZ38820.1 glutathione peroxidase [Sphingobacterium sp. PCS056]UXD71767.1 glutathione peroxidase [Sphingobacterium faecium]WGQ16960.1 glutathione peroxidase [Sphingobacterium faecium]HCU44679.1 glutathione peroxidase [Sphingobacterium sp.]
MILSTIIACFSMIFGNPSIYDYTFKSLDGHDVKMSSFKGKKILIVNTASKCGFTKQYKDLQELYKQYGKDLVIIGFPANNFGNQEPGTNDDIQEFCQQNFGVEFLMAEKVEVKGDQIDPLFKYLTSQDNPDFKGEIKWNFEKFLIDEHGKLVHRYRSAVNPLSDEIVNWVKK